ncbi:hypothetical protein JXA32_00860 [Candidatus Sumerlaeota bacterium]|nr:hypothetical protein [Candidatus Sumerlaeota bacterium]
MKHKYLTRQRIDRILDRQFDQNAFVADDLSVKQGAGVKQIHSVTFMQRGSWQCSLPFRRRSLVQRILADYEKKEGIPGLIPARSHSSD